MLMPDRSSKHRVIGIRSALKQFKKAGFIDADTMYAKDAVGELQDETLSVARKWYKVGAKRGGREILEAFLDGTFTLRTTKDDKIEIVAHADSVTWERSLSVTVGNKKQKIPKDRYKLTLKHLEFDV
jgi:hypothetical protein